jgi:hypothetical protein
MVCAHLRITIDVTSRTVNNCLWRFMYGLRHNETARPKEDSVSEIESIIQQLEQQRGAIERALLALREIAGTAAPGAKRRGRPPGTGGRRSAAVRKRMAEAQRRRWAEKRAAEASATKKTGRPAKKAKRVISPEGRARIAEAARRMWAARKKSAAK